MAHIYLEVRNCAGKASNFCRKDEEGKSQCKRYFIRVRVLRMFFFVFFLKMRNKLMGSGLGDFENT